MKKVIVTGGAGFIGSHVVDYLLQHGYKVFVLDNFSTGNENNLKRAIQSFSSSLEVEKIDIANNKTYTLVQKIRPHAIFHYAGQISVRQSIEDPVHDIRMNTETTLKLLEASKKAQVTQFIMASSAAVYGNPTVFPISENQIADPKSPYAISKKSAEFYLRYFAQNTSVQTIALRYSNVYGPRQNSKGEAGVIAIFFDKAMKGDFFTIYGDGSQTRDFVFVRDISKLSLKILENQTIGYSCLNVASRTEISINELVDLMNDILTYDGREKTSIVYEKSLPGDLARSVLDNQKVLEQYNWSPETNMWQGLQSTYLYFSGHKRKLTKLITS